MKSKGFMFTADAIFAIILVVLLATAYVNIYKVEGVDVEASKSLKQQAIDEALVSFYGDGSSTSTSISASARQGYCVTAFDYDLPASLSWEDYCKEMN